MMVRACEDEEVKVAVAAVERFARQKVHQFPRRISGLCGHKRDGGAGTEGDVRRDRAPGCMGDEFWLVELNVLAVMSVGMRGCSSV